MDWIAIAALGVSIMAAIGSALSRRFDSSLSIREHQEFKENVGRRIDGLEGRMIHELDRLERLILRKCGKEMERGEP